jgi:hypothetical protein
VLDLITCIWDTSQLVCPCLHGEITENLITIVAYYDREVAHHQILNPWTDETWHATTPYRREGINGVNRGSTFYNPFMNRKTIVSHQFFSKYSLHKRRGTHKRSLYFHTQHSYYKWRIPEIFILGTTFLVGYECMKRPTDKKLHLWKIWGAFFLTPCNP